MKHVVILGICLLGLSHAAKAEQDSAQPLASHGILIFLDNSEKELDPVARTLCAALDQKAGPIIVSSHLIALFIKQKNLDDLTKNAPSAVEQERYQLIKTYYEQLNNLIKNTLTAPTSTSFNQQTITQQLYNSLNKAIQNDEKLRGAYYAAERYYNEDPVAAALIKSYSSFKPEEWLIKAVNKQIVLLIPRTYIERLEKKYHNTLQAKSFSQLESLLGLQVDHMTTISSLQEFAENYIPSQNVEFIEALKKIFIPRTAYSKFIPSWSLFMVGHGMINKSIAGLSLAEFQKFLQFLDTAITTKLLVYLSCYAAGTNAEIIYKDTKIHSFTIATGAITDAPTSAAATLVAPIKLTTKDVNFATKSLQTRHWYNFADFITQSTTSADYVTFPALLGLVLPNATNNMDQTFGEQSSRKLPLTNIPQLKLPGIPWFTIVDIDKKIVSIGKTLAQSGRKEINISAYFGIKPAAILFYTNYIPCNLIISSETMPILICMTSDTAFYIEQITAKSLSGYSAFDDFIEAFNVISQARVNKTFWIRQLAVGKENFSNIIITYITRREKYLDIIGLYEEEWKERDMFRMEIYRIVSNDPEKNAYIIEQYNMKKGQWEKPTPEAQRAIKEGIDKEFTTKSPFTQSKERMQQVVDIQKIQEKKISEQKVREQEFNKQKSLETSSRLMLLEQSLQTIFFSL